MSKEEESDSEDSDMDYHFSYGSRNRALSSDEEDAEFQPKPLTDTKEPVVVLLGWMGCKDRYLEKYSSIYDGKGMSTVRFATLVPDFRAYLELLGNRGRSERLVTRIAGVLIDLDLHRQPLVFHIFSNSGFLIYTILLRCLHTDYREYQRLKNASPSNVAAAAVLNPKSSPARVSQRLPSADAKDEDDEDSSEGPRQRRPPTSYRNRPATASSRPGSTRGSGGGSARARSALLAESSTGPASIDLLKERAALYENLRGCVFDCCPSLHTLGRLLSVTIRNMPPAYNLLIIKVLVAIYILFRYSFFWIVDYLKWGLSLITAPLGSYRFEYLSESSYLFYKYNRFLLERGGREMYLYTRTDKLVPHKDVARMIEFRKQISNELHMSSSLSSATNGNSNPGHANGVKGTSAERLQGPDSELLNGIDLDSQVCSALFEDADHVAILRKYAEKYTALCLEFVRRCATTPFHN